MNYLARVELAVKRLSTRLSRGQEVILAGVEDLRANREEFSRGFEVFFPELASYVETVRTDLTENWMSSGLPPKAA